MVQACNSSKKETEARGYKGILQQFCLHEIPPPNHGIFYCMYPRSFKSLLLKLYPKSYKQRNYSFHHSKHYWNSMQFMCFVMVRYTVFFSPRNYQVIWILKSCYLHWSTIEFSTYIFPFMQYSEICTTWESHNLHIIKSKWSKENLWSAGQTN